MKITLFKFWIIFIFDPYHFKMWILVSKVYRVLNFFLLSMLLNYVTIKWQLHLKQHSIIIQKQSNFRKKKFYFSYFYLPFICKKKYFFNMFYSLKAWKGSPISSEKDSISSGMEARRSFSEKISLHIDKYWDSS